MKKIIILAILITLVSIVFGLDIETSSGVIHRGSLIKKVEDRYHIQTNLGERVVFQAEITRVISDSGQDITPQFLAIESRTEATPMQVSPYLITNLNQISTPFWIFTLASIGYYIYAISKMD
jgi:hypothetical protein